MHKQLAQGDCAVMPSQDLNPKRVNRKSDALPVAQRVTQRVWILILFRCHRDKGLVHITKR